ncbi:centrosomal protein of 135 kDa-like isoform X2 [Babylonia areolata]|uniref:centrosomal protein of 135 kDa-like isoform X2 n=1 Tax=Babylonia areolata TaxID=304850 RepID=UPI003FD01FE0
MTLYESDTKSICQWQCRAGRAALTLVCTGLRALRSVEEDQVEGRDEEIERLSKMLDGGRSSDVVALESKNRSNERMISHLNIQVDFLQQKNRELERKLADTRISAEDAESKLSRATMRNRDLERELHNMDFMAKKLQTDKDVVVHTADKEMGEAKTELEKSRYELEDLDNTVAQLKAENKRLSSDNVDLKSKLSMREADNVKLEDLLDRLQEEKKRLVQRNNKLTANEKDLVLEIERLKRKNGPAGTKKGKIPSKLDAFIRGIEEERDYYRQQADSLQRLARGEPMARWSRPTSRSASPAVDKGFGERKALAQQEAMVRVLEEEKEYYKKEYENLKALRRSATPSRGTPVKSAADEGEVFRLTRERDELKALLDKFERHMAEIQANVTVLTAERDKLTALYQETKEELMMVRRELVTSPKTSLAAQAVLRKVENERDDAVADLQRMTTERDSLRERIKIATDSSLSERAKLEQRIEDVEATLHTVESEREELLARVSSLKDDNKGLEEQTKDQAFRLNQMDEEVARFRSSAAQLKLLVEEAEKSLDETKHRLSRREKELHSMEQRSAALEDQLAQAQRCTAGQRDEISAMRNTLAAVDREKDGLQMAVDDKAEKVSMMNAELHDKERVVSDLKVRVGELEAQLHHANDSLNMKDREIKSLRRQVESCSEDLQEASRGRDLAMQENRRLQDDLSVMTRENQKLNGDLQEALAEREALKTQVQQYILEVRRVEDTLATKEQERSDLLEQYRKLSMEAEQYQTLSHQLEGEGSNLRLEIMTKDSELRRAHDKLDNQEREIQEQVHTQQAYEQQVMTLTRSVTTLEESLRQAEDERGVVRADLVAAKENAAHLDSLKEQLLRKQTALQLEKEQLQAMVEDLRQESECLKSQLSQERGAVKNLEGLLQAGREKEFQTQISSQERNTEIQMLKDRLSLNDSKIQAQSREVAALRTRNIELEGDVERLRRQLTNERFERERAVQELRRNGIAPPIMISEYSGDLSHNRSLSRERARSRSRSPSPARSPPRYRASRTQSPEPFHDDVYRDTSLKAYTHDVL